MPLDSFSILYRIDVIVIFAIRYFFQRHCVRNSISMKTGSNCTDYFLKERSVYSNSWNHLPLIVTTIFNFYLPLLTNTIGNPRSLFQWNLGTRKVLLSIFSISRDLQIFRNSISNTLRRISFRISIWIISNTSNTIFISPMEFWKWNSTVFRISGTDVSFWCKLVQTIANIV